MLLELKVANFALIENLTWQAVPGLNVLTGETGAGKSIVIGAISLLLGERAAAEQVRLGAETAVIEGLFQVSPALRPEMDALLESAGIAPDDLLILGRELSRSGRSVGRVNGRAVPVSFLKELGRYLIDLHGQHQHQSLLREEEQLQLLDAYGGEPLLRQREEVARLYRQRQACRSALEALGRDSAERERRMDLLVYQLEEIQKAKLTPGEEEELLQQEKLLSHAEKLQSLVEGAYSEIFAGSGLGPALLDRLSGALSALQEAAAIDPGLQQAVGLVESAVTQLQEAAYDLRDYRDRVSFDSGELAAVQERLSQIRSLKRKYGSTVEEVIAFARQVGEDLERLRNSAAEAEKLEKELAGLEEELSGAARRLQQLRLEAAARLSAAVRESLDQLSLPQAQFEIRLKEREQVAPQGVDRVEFMFSANLGEPVQPLAKVISGGEMSRVMLAIKVILAQQDRVPTLIFDEIDAGIGGVVIQSVAECLAHLSRHHQVICVTHNPQIAAMAEGHFMIYKEEREGRTVTRIKALEDQERKQELARMLDGGSADPISLRHGESLLERAERFKKNL